MLRRTIFRSASRGLILYGSQTGSAESLARSMSLAAMTHGFDATVGTLNDAEKLLADKPEFALIITSTCGVGEFPTNAENFSKGLKTGKFSKAFAGTPTAVFGLGNSKNEYFCTAAKSIDDAVTQAGGKKIIPPKYSCEMAPNGHELAFRQWRRDLWNALGASSGTGSLPTLYQVAPPSKDVVYFSKCDVVDNKLLSPQGYAPQNRSLKVKIPFEVQRSHLGRLATFKDQIRIMPKNAAADVNKVIARLGLKADEELKIQAKKGAVPSKWDNTNTTVREIFTSILDLHGLPARSTLEAFAMAATNSSEKAALEECANNLTAAGEYDKMIKGFTTILDVLEKYPSVKFTLEGALTHWPRIQPRTYSIAADPGVNGSEELEIAYSVATKVVGGNKYDGLCTSFLAQGPKFVDAELASGTIPDIPVDANLCLIALGTGVAPIRAVLQQRAAAKAAGKTVGKAILYYGYNHKGKSDMFMGEFEALVKQGILQEVVGVGSLDQKEYLTPLNYMDERVKNIIGRDGHLLYCGLGGAIPTFIENGIRKAGVDVGVLRVQKRYHEEYFSPDSDAENAFKDQEAASGAFSTLAAKYKDCNMFCFQCEQTFSNKGCHKVGVCGKTPRVAALQDLTVQGCKVMSFYLHRLREMGVAENALANHLTLLGMFATLTNVNFDEQRFVDIMKRVKEQTVLAESQYIAECKKAGKTPEQLTAVTLPDEFDVERLVEIGKHVNILTQFTEPAHQNVAGVCEMLIYSVKGICAYADHANMGGKTDKEIYAFIHEALSFMLSDDRRDLGKALGLVLKSGHVNVKTMGLLSESNVQLGVPEPTTIPVAPTPGKCILVSGHDMILLENLLELCEKEGINVYTHGEMLPSHSYPKLKAYKSLAGHYGGAWQRQAVEFPFFPGPILMTTNCLTPPHDTYIDNMFTCAAVGWNGAKYLGEGLSDVNWKPLIEMAKKMRGFTANDTEFKYADPIALPRPKTLTVGFGHEAVLGAAPVILDQIKKGNITRFFVVGGCDGFEGTRSYYTEFVQNLPKTCVILTVGCAKYRFNHLDLGTIGDTGIPRLLDMGQCSNSFSAVQVAFGLANALGCEVKDLPLSIVLSWFEQKAIAVLSSLIALGIKPLHVGPALPAFVTPDVLQVLVNDFGLRVVSDPKKDIETMCAAKAMS